MTSCITQNIFNSVKRARVFSISIDSTFNISRKEQIFYVICYTNEGYLKVEKKLLALREIASTKGCNLTKLFNEICT